MGRARPPTSSSTIGPAPSASRRRTRRARLWLHQLQLTIADWVVEVHDKPPTRSATACNYEDQEAPNRNAGRADFRKERLPKFVHYFERILKKRREILVRSICRCFQMMEGPGLYAFPRAHGEAAGHRHCGRISNTSQEKLATLPRPRNGASRSTPRESSGTTPSWTPRRGTGCRFCGARRSADGFPGGSVPAAPISLRPLRRIAGPHRAGPCNDRTARFYFLFLGFNSAAGRAAAIPSSTAKEAESSIQTKDTSMDMDLNLGASRSTLGMRLPGGPRPDRVGRRARRARKEGVHATAGPSMAGTLMGAGQTRSAAVGHGLASGAKNRDRRNQRHNFSSAAAMKGSKVRAESSAPSQGQAHPRLADAGDAPRMGSSSSLTIQTQMIL